MCRQIYGFHDFRWFLYRARFPTPKEFEAALLNSAFPGRARERGKIVLRMHETSVSTVIPAEAGIQSLALLDPGFRRGALFG
jgi:hypothetical protein